MKPITIELAGNGLWGAERGRSVTFTGFDIERYTEEEIADWADWATVGDIRHVWVYHDSTWDVYTDSGFVEAAQRFTGLSTLEFTEQGMQEDGAASMEVHDSDIEELC